MSLGVGARLGTYEISALLGKGGMGEVYRARDIRLGREVAIKVLAPALAQDAQFMARFDREAKVLASLNHPNIAAIFGIEQNAIVMELVEGEDLKGPLPIETALSFGRQIAAGLEAAHEKGIVHRDLKPANIKVTRDGHVKLLDFGLAQMTVAPSGDLQTLTMVTEPGMIMGTPAYMSPEQASGQTVDRRADIWAFGLILYEMLTGKRPFGAGQNVAGTVAAVMAQEPDWNALPADTPQYLRRLLKRCLRKDPRQRLQAIGEARIALDQPDDESVIVRRRPSWLPWAIAVGLAIIVAIMAWRTRHAPALRPLVRLNLDLPLDTTLAQDNGGLIALSPDGLRLAVSLLSASGQRRLYTRLLKQSQLTPLAGTEGAVRPFFSPDGRWIGFAADGKIKKVSAEGGATVTVCDGGDRASWGDDGNIVLPLNGGPGLSRVSPDSGNIELLTKLNPGEQTHRWPEVLPGSQAVLFTAHTALFNFDQANIEVVSIKTGRRTVVRRGGYDARYVIAPDGSGRVLYVYQGTLFAVPFDLVRLSVMGAPEPVAEDVSIGSRGADYAVSAAGVMAYVAGKGGQQNRTISWVDAAGKTEPLHTAPGQHLMPRFSPDGKRLVFVTNRGSGSDVWVKDVTQDQPSRLTALEGYNDWPVWTPDGRNIIFRSTSPAAPGIYWVRADGGGEAHRLMDRTLNEIPTSISPDGKRLAFSHRGTSGNADISTAPIEGESANPKLGKPSVFLSTPFMELFPMFSRDGRWLAYLSNESSILEVHVRAFPGPGGQWELPVSGGTMPVWSRDGRELLFESADHRVMAVSYTAKIDSFAFGKPRVWSEARMVTPGTLGTVTTWDLAPDGKRLAALQPLESEKTRTSIAFQLNFNDELQRMTAVGK